MNLPQSRDRVRWTDLAFGVLCIGIFTWQSGCGSSGSPGTLGEVGTYDADASGAFAGGDATSSGELDAHIEENHVAVKIVTLSCAGDCADVKAVATGGHPPYSFAWDDGSSNPARRVCPTADTNYHVKVTDTGVFGEVSRPAETVQVPLVASVLACPDGGTDSGVGLRDASADPGCAPVAIGQAPATCAGPSGGVLSTLDTGPLAAKVTTTIRVTGTGSYAAGQGWHYELWGSPDGCMLDELLGTFQLVNGPYDLDVCVTPTRGNAHLVLFYRFALTDGVSLSTLATAQCGGCEAASDP